MVTGGTSPLQTIHNQQACRLSIARGLSLEGTGGNQKAELLKSSFTESSQVDPANAQYIPALQASSLGQ